jgi:hypothetical protein
MQRALMLWVWCLALPVASAWSEEKISTNVIPWHRLSSDASGLVRDVVTQPLVARRVNGITYKSRPEIFQYLLDHPDFAATMARAINVGRYRVIPVPGGYEADDGRGVRGLFRPVYADAQRRVFYLAGRYDPPLFPAMTGRAVLVLDALHAASPDGGGRAEVTVVGFLKVDAVLARIVASVFRSFTQAAVDRKVRRFFRHVEKVSVRAHDDPAGLAQAIQGHPDLPPERVAEFRRLLLKPLRGVTTRG